MKREFSTPEPVRLLIELPTGRVELEAAETAETVVELEPMNGSDTTARAIEEALVEHNERDGRHEVRVEIDKRRTFYLGRTPQVHVRVRCPQGSSVMLSTAAADVRGIGRFGGVEVKNVSGETSFGDLEGNARLKAVSGDMRVGRVTGSGQFGTVSGDIRIEGVEGECSVRTVSGDLSIAEALSSVNASTVSGDLQLEDVASGRVELRSVSGDLRVGVRPGTNVWLDVSSRSGDVSSGLDASEAEGGQATVEIRASSVSGDIGIFRSTRMREPATDHAA